MYTYYVWQIWHPAAFWLWWPGAEILEEHCIQLSNLWSRHIRVTVWWGSGGVEYQLPWNNPGPDQEWDWHPHRRRQHGISVLWDVEVTVPMAHGGHGPLQYQLPTLWSSEVMVCCATRTRLSAGALSCRLVILRRPNLHKFISQTCRKLRKLRKEKMRLTKVLRKTVTYNKDY